MQDFIIFDHTTASASPRPEGPLDDGGLIRSDETIYEGPPETPRVFLAPFSGGNLGKALVRL